MPGLHRGVAVPDQEADVAEPAHGSEVAIGSDQERTPALGLQHRGDCLALVSVRDPIVAGCAAVAKDRPEYSGVERQETGKARGQDETSEHPPTRRESLDQVGDAEERQRERDDEVVDVVMDGKNRERDKRQQVPRAEQKAKVAARE